MNFIWLYERPCCKHEVCVNPWPNINISVIRWVINIMGRNAKCRLKPFVKRIRRDDPVMTQTIYGKTKPIYFVSCFGCIGGFVSYCNAYSQSLYYTRQLLVSCIHFYFLFWNLTWKRFMLSLKQDYPFCVTFLLTCKQMKLLCILVISLYSIRCTQ